MSEELERQSNSTLPPTPKGVSAKVWLDRQTWLLLEVRMPRADVCKIKTLRMMNLFCWLIPLGHDWKWIMDKAPILLDPKFKRKPGQA